MQRIDRIDKLIEEAINRSSKEFIVFGEMHNKSDEVNRICKEIIKLKPDYVIHELAWEDRDYYKKQLPNTKVLPLEPSMVEGKRYPKDVKQQFKIREAEMIKSLENAPPW